MRAGRALDALIAEKIFNLPGIYQGKGDDGIWLDNRDYLDAGDYCYTPTQTACRLVPHYSTDIAAAWLVVEHFYSAGWGAGVEMDGHTGCSAGIGQFTARADTPAHAICLAALKACGAEAER